MFAGRRRLYSGILGFKDRSHEGPAMRISVSTIILRRLFVCTLAFLFLLLPGYSQSIPSLDEILKRVSINVQVFGDTLPDFECRENVRQRTSYKKGQRPTSEQTGESIIRYFRSSQQLKGFTEQREYISINGKQIAKDEKVPEGLFLRFTGRPAICLTFSHRILRNLTVIRLPTWKQFSVAMLWY